MYSLKAALIYFICTITLHYYIIPVNALNIGVHANSALSLGKECSRTCESSFCKVAPLLRYGKYCGVLYGGCPGEKPCDGLDACCMKHDACIAAKNNDYLNEGCNKKLIECVGIFKKSGGKSFKGNTCQVNDVINVINAVMHAALLAGRSLHKP